MASRRLLLICEPLDGCNANEVAASLEESGVAVCGLKIDEIADVAYIVVETDASDYAIRGIARGWRICAVPPRH